MSDANLAKKFFFANSFEVGERGIVAVRDFTAADVQRAHAEGFDEGRLVGIAEQRAESEHITATALGVIGQRLGDLLKEFETVKNDTAADAAEAAMTILRKLLPHYVAHHGLEEIEGLVRDCLRANYDEPRVAVRVPEKMLEPLRVRLDDIIAGAGFGGKVVLFPDPAIGDSDCRVEWADGGTERDSARLWREIENTIAQFLGKATGTKTDQAITPGVEGPAS